MCFTSHCSYSCRSWSKCIYFFNTVWLYINAVNLSEAFIYAGNQWHCHVRKIKWYPHVICAGQQWHAEVHQYRFTLEQRLHKFLCIIEHMYIHGCRVQTHSFSSLITNSYSHAYCKFVGHSDVIFPEWFCMCSDCHVWKSRSYTQYNTHSSPLCVLYFHFLATYPTDTLYHAHVILFIGTFSAIILNSFILVKLVNSGFCYKIEH
jgi:hypothetical protein